MSYIWKIRRAAIEQEIIFPSELSYAAFREEFNASGKPLQIVSEVKEEDGTVTAVIRKQYNNNDFLYK